jgi:hypothetical protein
MDDNPDSQTGRGRKDALFRIYANMAFLGSRVERARRTLKEMEGFMDMKNILDYSGEELYHIEYSVKDLSGKIMKYIQEGDFK